MPRPTAVWLWTCVGVEKWITVLRSPARPLEGSATSGHASDDIPGTPDEGIDAGPRRVLWHVPLLGTEAGSSEAGEGLLIGHWGGGGDQPSGECGPHDLSGVAQCGVAPSVTERADDVQPAAGLGEKFRWCLEYWSGPARVGNRAQQARPRCCSSPSRIGRAWPGSGRACRSALVSSSEMTIAMSSLRSATPHRRKVARANSLATRTDLGPVPGARVAIRGRWPWSRAGFPETRKLPFASPALCAATISHRQSAPPPTGAACAVATLGSPWPRSPVLITAATPSPSGRCQADRGDLGRWPRPQGLTMLGAETLSVGEHGRAADKLLLPFLDRQG
jgi:hypothetical protein